MITPADAAAEVLARRKARETFTHYCAYRLPEDQSLAPHHVLLTAALDEIEKGECDRLLVMMPPGSAKALALDTPIPTLDGWKKMGDLRVGDRLFDENGLPCSVTWVSPIWHSRPVYEVTTDCGDKIIADRDHEWLVRMCGKRDVFKIKETHELARARVKRVMVRRAKALALPEADLPIDPYLLGVWLGDGHSAGMLITASVEDQTWMRAEIERLGYQTSDSSQETLFGVSGVRGEFAAMSLINDPYHNTSGRKHIPDAYMRASAGQRLALLQGLIDTDGTVCKKRGCATFCNTNHALALQVRELVRSLGVKAGWSVGRAMLNGKDCGEVYRVSFYHAEAARMPRKRALCRNQYRTPDTYIDVKPAGLGDTVCIEVDSPSHLFLCGKSMTPTHNSTYGSVYFPEYFAGRNPQLSIIAASHTAELAERFGRRVRNGLCDEQFKVLFPTVALAADSTAAGRWGTNHGGEYTAVGVGGSVTGRRGDLIVVDDPVRSREDADSERVREKTWDWWTNDLLTRLKPGGRIVVIGTRWHEDDLQGRILEREPQRWKVIKLPMIAGDNDPLGREPGERLWKEWFTDEMVRQAQQDPRSWISLYQQEPRPAEGAEFKRSWITRYNTAPKKLNKIILVDPAGDPQVGGNRRKKSDRTVMWVVGLASDGNAYLVDGVIDRLTLTQRAEKLFDLHKRHKPVQVRYERYGMQADIPHIQSEMEHRQYRFKITEVGGQVDKNARIRRLIPWFEHARMWLPQQLTYTDVTGQQKELVQELLDVEYATFPVGRFDDGMDCLARIDEPSLTLPWPDEDEWQVPTGAEAAWEILDNVVGY